MSDKIEIRKIREKDNKIIAKIIRDSLVEFKANKPGTVYYDEATDHLYELFKTGRAVYFILVLNEKVAGGAGIYPTNGLPGDTCELVKIYLEPSARGKGLGKSLLESCIQAAKSKGFKKIYLETMPELRSAIPMYEKSGFKYLDQPMGNSGHTGCDLWMIKDI